MDLPRFLSFGLTCLLLAALPGCSSEPVNQSEGPPAGTVPVRLQQVASGLGSPLYLTAPPGDSRLFIVEQGGRIRIVKEGGLLPTPFLDISDRIVSGGEQGLLGLAFDPGYASNGRFVVHYTNLEGDTRVTMFQVSADPDLADPASERLILATDQPFSNHNGGQILFGPDGYLYLGLGDGGGSGDPEGRGQGLADLLGSILRVDVSSGDSYTVPADNPFVGRTDAAPEVWSYGLRNPWRFSFDRATGDLWIADVGQDAYEEVNFAPAASGAGRAVNYGWDIMEGTHCFAADTCDQSGLVLPVFEYDHGQGCSVTGGYVYRGAAIPELQGHYLYGDYCSGWVRSFRLENGTPVDHADWPTLRPGSALMSFGEDTAGELYVVVADGAVYRVVPASGG